MNRQELIRLALNISSPLVVLTLVCGLVYAAMQQNYRQNANDPQVQIVEDTVNQLKEKKDPQTFSTHNSVDPSKSLQPFMIIYDSSGKIVASEATINGQIPELPDGVFDTVRVSGENRFTWQTKDGTRMAAVINYYNVNDRSGFVLAARSLKEVEMRENHLMLLTGLAYFFGFVALIALEFIKKFMLPRR